MAPKLIVAALLLTPVLLHLAAARHWPAVISMVCVSVQTSALIAVVLTQAGRWKWPLAGAAVLLAIVLIGHYGERGLVLSAGVPHAAAHLTLLTIFVLSLRPGREPLITGIIRRVRGPLQPELVLYGRQVTVAWVCFFAAHLVISLTLVCAAPLEKWSLFINIVNLPSILMMFAGEYIYRRIRFRHLPVSRIKDVVRGISNWRAGTTSTPLGEAAGLGEP